MRALRARIEARNQHLRTRLSRQDLWLAGAAVLPALLVGYSALATLLSHGTDVVVLFAALPVTVTAILVIRNLVRSASPRGGGAEMPDAHPLAATARH